MSFNLWVMSPSPTDATSFYRSIGPLGALKRSTNGALQISILPQFDWSYVKLIDAIFLQRPYRQQDVEFIQRAKAQGKPIYIDYDDDLLHVLPDNPAYRTYADPKTQKAIAQCIAMADIVTVATEQLKTLFEPIARRIEVIPNALDDELFGDVRQPNSGAKHVLWRGSPTHHRDLDTYKEQIIAAALAHPDWTFTFVGHNPWYITEKMGPTQAVCVDMMDPLDYMAFMRKVAPRIVIVPLASSDFNAAKSNIAWLEASHAGALALAPDTTEWKRPGIVNYKTPADFGATLDRLMTDDVDCEPLVKQSWDFITENLLLSKVNTKRRAVVAYLEELLHNREWQTEAREGRGDRAQATA